MCQLVLESVGVQHWPPHRLGCWFLPEEQKVRMYLNCNLKSIQRAPSSGTCPQHRKCSGRNEILCSNNTDEVYMCDWKILKGCCGDSQVSIMSCQSHKTYTMMAEDGEYTKAERGMAIELFWAWFWCSVWLGSCWVCKIVSRFQPRSQAFPALERKITRKEESLVKFITWETS